MKTLETQTRNIIAFGLLMLTWLMIAVFLIYMNAYQISYDRSFIISSEAEYKYQELLLEKQKCGDFYCYSGEEFINLYKSFIETKNLSEIEENIIIDGASVDEYLRNKAEERGYEKRGKINENELVEYNELMVLPEIRDAYLSLRNRASRDGVGIHLVSAYRSFEDQRELFLSQFKLREAEAILLGLYDTEIDQVLSVTALPGYSKHHEGYTVDFACGDDYLVYEFKDTNCYQWISENNFEKSKRFGFIPSYPEGVEEQGPSPEAWEYIYFDKEMIR